MTKGRSLGIMLLGVAALGGLWATYLSDDSNADRQYRKDAVPVTMARVMTSDVPVILQGLGIVQAYNSVLVRSRVDGQIKSINFTEGEPIKEGALLAVVDPAPFKVHLAHTTAVAARDSAQLANARLNLHRLEYLVNANAVSKQQLDTARSQVDQLDETVKADQADIHSAKLELKYSQIRSPITGRIGVRLIDAGNIVRASEATGIAIVNQIKPIYVSFTLPEADLSSIRAAMRHGPVSVYATDGNGAKLASGRLSVINNQINETTATITLKAFFANRDEVLWPRQFVSVDVLVRRLHDVLTIPVRAVQNDQKGSYVFIVAHGIARKRAVSIVLRNDKLAVISSGLKAGQTVITSGQYRIETGSAVREAAPAHARETTP